MYREADARHRVYFNLQHTDQNSLAYIHRSTYESALVQFMHRQKTERGLETMQSTRKCVLENQISLIFHNGGG